jgi:hypothetical protein
MFIEITVVILPRKEFPIQGPSYMTPLTKHKLTLNSAFIEQVRGAGPNKENINAIVVCKFRYSEEKYYVEETKEFIDQLLSTVKKPIDKTKAQLYYVEQ